MEDFFHQAPKKIEKPLKQVINNNNESIAKIKSKYGSKKSENKTENGAEHGVIQGNYNTGSKMGTNSIEHLEKDGNGTQNPSKNMKKAQNDLKSSQNKMETQPVQIEFSEEELNEFDAMAQQFESEMFNCRRRKSPTRHPEALSGLGLSNLSKSSGKREHQHENEKLEGVVRVRNSLSVLTGHPHDNIVTVAGSNNGTKLDGKFYY